MKTSFSRLGTSVPPSGIAVISSGESLTVIGWPRVSECPAESFTVASIRTRAAPWLRGRPAKYFGNVRSKKKKTPRLVLPPLPADPPHNPHQQPQHTPH